MVRGNNSRSKKIAILVTLTSLLLVLVSLYIAFYPRQKSVEFKLTQATAQLLDSANDLQQSFGEQHDAARTTRTYLNLMDQIVYNCNAINGLRVTNNQSLGNQLKNSQALCKDLTSLAEESISIYRPAEKLLLANAKSKRYQTLPPLKSITRDRHLAYSTQAIEQISNDGFSPALPTRSLELLEQLNKDIQNSKDLAYYPSLAKFQNQLLAERQQYWSSYADLADLIAGLNSQLDNYCNSNQQTQSLSICTEN